MRGSQWEERGSPIGLERVLVAVGIIVVLCVLAVYFYTGAQGTPAPSGSLTSNTTTGVGCGVGSLPEAAAEVETDPRFTALSGGRCYDYVRQTSSEGGSILTFDNYNGTITYPCGTTAYDVVAGQIDANVTSSGAVVGVWAGSGDLNPLPSCGATPVVSVVSVTDVSSLIPAVPELEITMEASPGGEAVTSLRASLTLAGTTQEFVMVASPSTLEPGGQTSKTEIVSPEAPFSSAVIYPMSLTGTLADGQTFDLQAYVQIADIP